MIGIKDRISRTPTGELYNLWKEEKKHWILDGFSIAEDATNHRPPIPVLLYTNNAMLVLSIHDYRGDLPVIANSEWLIEKVSSSSTAEDARYAADVQRKRILSKLASRIHVGKTTLLLYS